MQPSIRSAPIQMVSVGRHSVREDDQGGGRWIEAGRAVNFNRTGPMKIHSLLLLSAALFSLLPAPPARADGNIEINPTTGTAKLTLLGQPAMDGASGFVIQHIDDGTVFGPTEPVSVGKFVLLRPIGFYQWNFSEANGDERPAMELGNNHSLFLRSSLASDRDHAGTEADPELNAIELRPGAVGGVFFNGVRLASAAESALSLAGASLVCPPDFYLYPGWGPEESANGLIAAGPSSLAFGAGSVAIGRGAQAQLQNSIALGYHAFSNSGGLALGNFTHTEGGLALGNGAYAMYWSTAIGWSAYCNGLYSTALGATASAVGYYTIGIGAHANANYSFAAAWGATDGESSIVLGGYAHALKSFAGASGVAWGQYSVALGRGTIAAQDYQTVLGNYNVDGSRSVDANGIPADTTLQESDPIFVIGNGHIENDGAPNFTEVRSNALTVDRKGATWVQGGLTVEGGPVGAPATSVFKQNVSVQGVLRVPESGDLSMGAFQAGTAP
jgi:hypothetical protein